MKLTDPPAATVSTRISVNAARISGELVSVLISIAVIVVFSGEKLSRNG
jgi:hypothetical protein